MFLAYSKPSFSLSLLGIGANIVKIGCVSWRACLATEFSDVNYLWVSGCTRLRVLVVGDAAALHGFSKSQCVQNLSTNIMWHLGCRTARSVHQPEHEACYEEQREDL